MEKVISGIRPTGNLHLGNYFGAVKSFVKMQEEYNCMFFIADWHSLTTHPTPENLRTSVRTILAEYLACGIINVINYSHSAKQILYNTIIFFIIFN